MGKAKLTVRQVVLFGLLGALIFCAKVVMEPLPNIEPVTLLIMIYAAVLGRKALYPTYLYVVLDILLHGIQLWNVNYLYIWLVPLAASRFLRGQKSPFIRAAVAGVFGLLFGLLCAPVYLFAGGLQTAIAWWLSGIPFDLLHGVGNFVLVLVLFNPLRKLLTKLYARCMNEL